jgi:uncharacterized membrane protein
MNWTTFFSLYAISVPIFFIIDIIWLGFVASNFYRERIGHLMEINWTAALVFYFVFLVGLTYFAIYPALQDGGGWQKALLLGALFGFFTYATYDLTNLATLKNWPLSLVVVDIIWGTTLGASVAAGTLWVYSFFA